MIKKAIKKFKNILCRKNIKNDNKKENIYTKDREDLYDMCNIKVGDIVKLNNYAKNKFETNYAKYGCCGNDKNNCICEKMFKNENLVGLVVELNMPMISVLWPNNSIGSTIYLDIDSIISKE